MIALLVLISCGRSLAPEVQAAPDQAAAEAGGHAGYAFRPAFPEQTTQLLLVNTYDMIFTQPVVTELEAIQVPTTLILNTRYRTGPGRGWQQDVETYELGRYDLLGEQVVARIPQGKLIELEGLGHLAQVEDFARYSHALDQALADAQQRPPTQ